MKEIFEIIWAVFELIGGLVQILVAILLIIVTMVPSLIVIKRISKSNDDIKRLVTKYIVKIFNICKIPIKEREVKNNG